MDFRDITEFIKDTIGYVIVAVVVILLFLYVISFQQVMGPSMNPTFNENDIVLISKVHYKLSDVKRGDIVVLEHDGVKNLIKRVVGLPGEHIEYKNGKLYINGVIYSEKYLDELVTPDFNITSLGSYTVPDDEYFVLGDNRLNSQDSRSIGFIKKNQIIGKVVMRFWPLNKVKFY